MYEVFCVRNNVSGTHFADAQTNSQINSFNEYLAYFGAGCSINGEATQEATQTVSALIKTLENLKNLDGCGSVSRAISNLSVVESSLNFYNSNQSEYFQMARGLENRKYEILGIIAITPVESPTYNELLEELHNVQLSMVEFYGRAESLNAYNDFAVRRNSLNSAMTSTRAVFQAIKSSQSCWLDHPSLLGQTAGLASALGQTYSLGMTSSTSVPYFSTAIALGSQIISHIANLKYDKKIKNFQGILKPTAMTCTLETLSRQYCAARDTLVATDLVLSAIDPVSRSRKMNSELSPVEISIKDLWSSIRLIEREVPKITDWLEKVRAGTTPTNSGASFKKNEINEKESLLRSARDSAYGIIADYKKRFDRIDGTDPIKLREQKWQLEKQAILEIIKPLFQECFSSSCPAKNPLLDVYDTVNISAYYLVGANGPILDGNGNIKDFKNSFNPFKEWNGDGVFDPSLEIVERKFEVWYEDANNAFKIQKTIVTQDDPFLIFAEGYPKSLKGQQKGLGVYSSLKTIARFLKQNRESILPNNGLSDIYKETQERLDQIIAIFDKVLVQRYDPILALSEVSKVANLDSGTTFLENRLLFFIRSIVENLVLKNSTDPQKLVLLSSFDVLQTLSRITGSRSILDIRTDAQSSKTIIQATLLQTAELFKSDFKYALADYDNLSSMTRDEGPRKMKAELCFNLLSLPVFSRGLSLNECLNLTMEPTFQGGPETPVITKELLKADFLDRICILRDYKRRTDIHQSLLDKADFYDFK